MALSPQDIRDTTFATTRRGGYDPAQVDAFKAAAADALQQAVQNATAMEARARAAVGRLQELAQGGAGAAAPAVEATPAPADAAPPERDAPAEREPTVEESETISRTLLLAQRTADAAVADARAEAAGIIDAAKAESRRAGEAERVRVEGEVQALLAKRDFLESDVDQLVQHLEAERQRIAAVVTDLDGLVRGLVPSRRPQLSAADQDAPDPAGDGTEPDVAELIDEVVETAPHDPSAEIARVSTDTAESTAHHSLFDADDR